MHYLWQPLLSVGVLHSKDASMRINDLLQLPKTRTSRYGNESLSFWGSMVWNRLPDIYKAAKSCDEFKMKIKSWKGSGCSCRICMI